MRVCRHVILILASGLTAAMTRASAEEMPVRIYTTADGLARDDVHSIRRDSHGLLWFGTAEGLSIFDGYQFTNYGIADGLPNRSVMDILETRNGEYWIATYNGLCRFDPKPSSGKHFIPYRVTEGTFANQINRLIQRRDGSIWFGTEGGLWRLIQNGARYSAERVRLPSREEDLLRIFSLVEDRRGTLWVSSGDGLFAIEPDGVIGRAGPTKRPPEAHVTDVLEDAQSRIWAATAAGLCAIERHAGKPLITLVYPMTEDYFEALFQALDGKFFAAGMGLFEFRPAPACGRPEVRQMITQPFQGYLGPIAEDQDGNLWVGGPGAMKVTRHGFTRFSTSDGLRSFNIPALTQDRTGRLYVLTMTGSRLVLHAWDNTKFIPVDTYLPAGFAYAWGDAQITFQDHAGEWWVPTANGLLRFAAPARLSDLARNRPKNVYTRRDGLPNDTVLHLFEDSHGDIWIGLYRGLARWDRRTGRIQSYGGAHGLPLVTERPASLGTPLYIAEDRQGDVWVGFHPYGVARFRRGRFQFYSEADGLPKGQINWIYSDHLGRLWIASSQGGAARIDDIAAPRPFFHTYTIAEGLSSNQIYTVVEDREGRIYLGGGRGVDRLDPDRGNVRHFTTADGLPPVRVQYALRDSVGTLWFASGLGLSRYVPETDRPKAPEAPLIRRLYVAGKAVPVSALGEREIAGVRLAPAQNNLRIEFGSIHFRSGEVLRYQYRLKGADRAWSAPADERTVTYSSLPPGSYGFTVRAINGDGLESVGMAALRFVIVPPLWRRPSAIAFELALLAMVIYLVHWYRVRQLLRMEHLRLRLASDLHDDIGSGLSEIAILTEVAVAQPHSAGQITARVGDRARQLREGMSDIVWSVDPRQRSLAELINRIRQSVYSMLESNGRRVEFEAPDASATAGIPLTPDRARHALLICREALANIARHAAASEVSVRMRIESDKLVVDVRDNGRGFDPQASSSGMGLRNLRRRAAEAGGELGIDSSPGHGTRVKLRLPLR